MTARGLLICGMLSCGTLSPAAYAESQRSTEEVSQGPDDSSMPSPEQPVSHTSSYCGGSSYSSSGSSNFWFPDLHVGSKDDLVAVMVVIVIVAIVIAIIVSAIRAGSSTACSA
jgi:hypothetical protein